MAIARSIAFAKAASPLCTQGLMCMETSFPSMKGHHSGRKEHPMSGVSILPSIVVTLQWHCHIQSFTMTHNPVFVLYTRTHTDTDVPDSLPVTYPSKALGTNDLARLRLSFVHLPDSSPNDIPILLRTSMSSWISKALSKLKRYSNLPRYKHFYRCKGGGETKKSHL